MDGRDMFDGAGVSASTRDRMGSFSMLNEFALYVRRQEAGQTCLSHPVVPHYSDRVNLQFSYHTARSVH